MKNYILKLRTYAKWLNSCTTLEQVENLEKAIRRNFNEFPEVLKIVISNQKALLL